MSYEFRLGKILLPIPPEKMEINVNGNNKTLNLINDGEINVLKKSGLVTVNFEFMLPNYRYLTLDNKTLGYPFATYEDGFKDAGYFLEEIKKLKVNLEPFHFTVIRTMPKGLVLFDTDLKVALEDYTIKESSSYGFDVVVSIKLKQYKDYGVKDIGTATEVTRETSKSPEPKSKPKTYTVAKGDSLWTIAKSFYGDGGKYDTIAKANGISNPNLISEGKVLTIPILGG